MNPVNEARVAFLRLPESNFRQLPRIIKIFFKQINNRLYEHIKLELVIFRQQIVKFQRVFLKLN